MVEEDALEALDALASMARYMSWLCYIWISLFVKRRFEAPTAGTSAWIRMLWYHCCKNRHNIGILRLRNMSLVCSDERLDDHTYMQKRFPLDNYSDLDDDGRNSRQRKAAQRQEKIAPQKWVQCAKCELWRKVIELPSCALQCYCGESFAELSGAFFQQGESTSKAKKGQFAVYFEERLWQDCLELQTWAAKSVCESIQEL